jgi:hypothetical protein
MKANASPAALFMMTVAGLLSATAGAEPPEAVARFALVIGHNQPLDSANPVLRFADDDAVAAHELFEQVGARCWLLTTLDADSQQVHPAAQPFGPPDAAHLRLAAARIRGAIEHASERGRLTALYVFYSGHGAIEHGEGQLALRDSTLSRGALSELLAGLEADSSHVMIDACRSYYMVFDKGPGGQRAPYPEPFVGVAGGERQADIGFIVSTSADRDSHEWERIRSGVFSHQVLSGLRGGADVDGDGTVTYAELGAFLESANRGIASPRLRPSFFIRPPGPFPGDLSRALLRWAPHDSILVLDRAVGHVFVEDPAGRRVLDLHPAAGFAARLHLPPNRPLFVRSRADAREWTVERNGRCRLSEVRQGRLQQPRPKSARDRALRRLFAEPFGRRALVDFRSAFFRGARLAVGLAELRAAELGRPIAIERRAGSVRPLAVLKWSGLGLALLAGGSAVTLGTLAEQESRAARDQLWGTPAWRAKADRARELALSSNITAGLAGALAAGSLVLFLIDHFAGGPGGVEASAAAGGGGAAARLGVRF